MNFRFAVIAFLSLSLSLVTLTVSGQDSIDFGTQVRPIIADRCFHCHGPDSQNQDSSYRMDSEEALREAIDADDPASSELLQRIFSDDPDTLMPKPDSNRVLSAEEKDILKRWVLEGAAYQKHWAFVAPDKPLVPELSERAKQAGWPQGTVDAWSQNPIDAFIGSRLIEQKLRPSSSAEATALLRRSALTLTGMLPSQATYDRFTAGEPAERYGTAVDALLNSDDYAERQTLRWLDAARYADTDGYQNDYQRENWPWRDWVLAAYRDNMPFDQFVIEQIAGDMLPGSTHLQQLATAFNRNHRQNAEGGALAEEFSVENVIDRVETTSTVFLGLTFGCARCHDHKYDPLSQAEFYQMYAYFNNVGDAGIGRGVDAEPTLMTVSPLSGVDEQQLTELREAGLEFRRDSKKFKKRFGSWVKQMVAIAKNLAAEKLADQDESQAATPQEKPNDPVAKSRPDPAVQQFQKIPGNLQKLLGFPTRNGGQLNKLRKYFAKVDPTRSELTNRLNAAKKAAAKHGAVGANVMVMKEREGKPIPAYVLDRGQYDAPIKSKPLSRNVPEVLWADGAEAPANRLELAQWLVSRDNPLTARVSVNRIWRDHFGTGLVKTTGDFGVQGEVPSHPKLLDWLAVQFIDSGWDVKAMHRLILTSQTYQQSSKSPAKLLAVDPDNRLLARGPRFRADGFTIRDIALQASQLLNPDMGGPPVKPYQPKGLWEVVAADKGTRYRPSKGEALYRKSMYSYWKRAVNPPRQTIFDAGGREVCDVEVRRTNTPLQALVLMNDQTFVEAARALAESVMQVDFASDDDRIAAMYRQAIARPADEGTTDVLRSSLSYFQRHFSESPAEAKKLLAVGEHDRDSTLNVTEHAALTAVAHVILNLDEFVNVE